TATAVESALRRRGDFEVERASMDDLARASWRHELNPRGRVTTAHRFGARASADLDVVFNRLVPATSHFNRWNVTDRQYAHSELLAFVLSWLESLGDRVVNRPVCGNLVGPMDKPWLWLARAHKAGLLLHPSGATTSTRRFPAPRESVERVELLPASGATHINRPVGFAARPEALVEVLVVGDRIVRGHPAQAAHEACRRLARLAGTDVLSVRLSLLPNDAEWHFVDANAVPALEDDESLDALATLLALRARPHDSIRRHS
ncbi:MAG TPA: hypothetical protein VIV63_16875, partial [Steroidobacteraceae bacterium]